jgi:hypothetical protein
MKKVVKLIGIIAVAAIMVLTFTACDIGAGDPNLNNNTRSETESELLPIYLGICYR